MKFWMATAYFLLGCAFVIYARDKWLFALNALLFGTIAGLELGCQAIKAVEDVVRKWQ